MKTEPMDVLFHDTVISMAFDDNDGNNGDDDEEEDDDNVVVREIDVFLSPEMEKQLYLLQYPLQQQQQQSNQKQPSRNDSKNTNSSSNGSMLQPINRVRMKPRHNRLDIDHPVPLNRIEQNDNGNQFSLYERTYTSQAIPIPTHMCIGQMKIDKETKTSSFHLVPLLHIYQMRPTFNHVDDAYNNNDPHYRRDSTSRRTDDTTTTNDTNSAFKRKESERAQMARLNSYVYKKQSEDNEAWFELQLLDYQSVSYHTFIKNMICQHPTRFVLKETTTGFASSYVNTLNYTMSLVSSTTSDTDRSIVTVKSTSNNNNNDDSNISTTTVNVPILTMRLVSLLRLGWQVPYMLIRHKFPSTTIVTDDTLTTSLSACCVLIRGNFTLQSRFVSILDKKLQPIRTFILLLLHEYGYIQRPALVKVFTSISNERIGRLLEMNAKPVKYGNVYNTNNSNDNKTNSNIDNDGDSDDNDGGCSSSSSNSTGLMTYHHQRRGWVPKIEDDCTFPKLFPTVYKLHEQYWQQQKLRFSNQLILYKQNWITGTSASTSAVTQTTKQ